MVATVPCVLFMLMNSILHVTTSLPFGNSSSSSYGGIHGCNLRCPHVDERSWCQQNIVWKMVRSAPIDIGKNCGPLVCIDVVGDIDGIDKLCIQEKHDVIVVLTPTLPRTYKGTASAKRVEKIVIGHQPLPYVQGSLHDCSSPEPTPMTASSSSIGRTSLPSSPFSLVAQCILLSIHVDFKSFLNKPKYM